MQPLILCMFLASSAVLRASGCERSMYQLLDSSFYFAGASKRVLDFLNIFNGEFDNELQTKEFGDDHDFMQARMIPVDIKCLPNPVLFVEEYFNNITGLFLLAEVKDGIEDTVSLTIYNLTGYNKYKPGEYNVDNLSNISCGDLHGNDGCFASYRVSSKGYAFGNFPKCGAIVKGQHPRFTCIHECASFTSSVPMYLQQRSPAEPYELQLRGLKYPLINPPTDYVSPCGN